MPRAAVKGRLRAVGARPRAVRCRAERSGAGSPLRAGARLRCLLGGVAPCEPVGLCLHWVRRAAVSAVPTDQYATSVWKWKLVWRRRMTVGRRADGGKFPNLALWSENLGWEAGKATCLTRTLVEPTMPEPCISSLALGAGSCGWMFHAAQLIAHRNLGFVFTQALWSLKIFCCSWEYCSFDQKS